MGEQIGCGTVAPPQTFAPSHKITMDDLWIPYYYFLTPILNSQGMKKITLCNTEKYKNQAGMNLIPPLSQNSHAVRWHCTAESKRRVAEIVIIIIIIIIINDIYIGLAQVLKGHKCAMSAEMAVWLRNCLCLYSYLHN